MRPVICIIAKNSYSKYCIEFLEEVRKNLKKHGNVCDIEWTHMEDEGPFDDGFSDEYVFDSKKFIQELRRIGQKIF